jgi:ATP-dependent DNA helicase DinG
VASGAYWPLRPVLAHLAAARPAAAVDLKDLRARRVKAGKSPELPDASDVELTHPDREGVLAEFEPGGLVGSMYERYETRQEQGRMADAVLEAMCEGAHLAVEAGTGVGKSVAYLVPAVRFAEENDVAVGVATKTNALMDQLVYQELPALAAELEGGLAYAALKGYEHYPCLRKLRRALGRDDLEPRGVADLAAVLAWVAQTTWGDLDSLNIHWSRALRAEVAATVDECTRKRCTFFGEPCYLHGMRRRARSARIVVTNHALLMSDLALGGGVLPPVRHWVVDEAHGAEATARDQLSYATSHGSLRFLLGALSARRGGPLVELAAGAETAADEESAQGVIDAAEALQADAATALTVADSFFSMVKELPLEASSEYDRAHVRLTTAMREGSEWGIAARVGVSLAKRLEALFEQGRDLLTRLEETGMDEGDARADLVGLVTRLATETRALGIVLDGSDPDFVYSVTRDRRPDVTAEALDAQRLDVGEVLAELFYPQVRSVTFTSATIATGDDFSHFARGVGLDRLEPEAWRALRLASSYDFERQMAVFVPADLAEPKHPAYLDALEDFLYDIHLAMGGSVLTLFTNRRHLEELYSRLVGRLETQGLRLVGQRGAGSSVKRVRDEFVADETASLFATKSFWEGFDAKGDTLRCVVVTRLPFAHPGDPVLQELEERDRDAWWDRHYLPRAILELKQAAGRLIRSSTDEGCLVIADSRVASSRPYARRFLAALPVEDVEVVEAAEAVRRIEQGFGR